MALTSAQIASILQISSETSLITGAAEITDVSDYASIGITSGDTVKVLLWIQDPSTDTFYKNSGYDAANFASPDLLPLTTPDSYSFTLPTISTGDYWQGQYNVNMKVQVTQGSDITEAFKTLYMDVCGCCNGIVADVRGEVSYNTAIVSVTDYTDYKTWTALTNVLVLYPPTNTGSAQTGTFHGSPATLVYEPPVDTFPYTGTWQWKLTSNISYTDAVTQSTTTCQLTGQGSFQVTQSELCKVRCLLDKYRTEVYASLAVKPNPALEKKFLFAEADFLMAIQSAFCGMPQTTIDRYVTNIYSITGIDPDCDCGCSDGTSQPLVPTSIINGADGADGTIIYSGSGAPSGGTGVVGDYYIRTDNGFYYKKTGASTWTFLFDATGATGAAGADGADGVAILENLISDSSTAGTAWETLKTYSVTANTLNTDKDMLHIRVRFRSNGTRQNQEWRVQFNGSTVAAGSFYDNIGQATVDILISRLSNTTAKYEVIQSGNISISGLFYVMAASGGLAGQVISLVTSIAGLNWTTTAYDINAQGDSVVIGDVICEELQVTYYHKV